MHPKHTLINYCGIHLQEFIDPDIDFATRYDRQGQLVEEIILFYGDKIQEFKL
jgi:hypothetical protein